MLKPRRRGKARGRAEAEDEADAEAPTELDVLEAYVRDPVPQTTLVMVAADVDRTRKLYKTILKQAHDRRMLGAEGRAATGASICGRWRGPPSSWCARPSAGAGQQIEPGGGAADRGARRHRHRAAARRRRAAAALYVGGAEDHVDDARQVVSAETAQDDWAVTNAIQRRDAAEALRQVALALESGGVSYQILGQLAWFVREKMVSRTRGGCRRRSRRCFEPISS